MCGICGIVRPPGQPIDGHELLRMRDVLTHRGPDAGGHYLDSNVGLGHRRLKIIDLSEAAAQPMGNEDGSVIIVFNGEIYNHRVLRRQLEARGHVFRSCSDTEVAVHGYEEWGERCVERFNGMFAIALYDRPRRELFLARDHLGIKPLYYCATPGYFLFASEIKAFREVAGFQEGLNEEALVEYLLYRSLAGAETLHRGVTALEPGHWLRLAADLTVSTKRYWDVELNYPPVASSFEDQGEQVLALLKQSVAMQEMSDVPIGAQLSGGTDSGLVTALMAERATRPIMTYAVGFPEEDYSELSHARKVASRLGTDHHEIILTNEGFADTLDTLSWHMDEPLTHSNAAGVYWLCRQAKTSVTVLLTGEGADEVFAGYRRYDHLRKSLLARRWLSPLAPLLTLAPSTPRVRLLKRALRASPQELTITATAMSGRSLVGCLDDAASQRAYVAREAVLGRGASRSWLDQALYYDLKTYLPPILMRQDKMSMAHGVETRVPFLDHRLVQLAFRLPLRSKLHGGHGKWLVKSIAARYLPRDVIYRPKVGFGLPLVTWMRSDAGVGARLTEITEPSSLSAQVIPRSVLIRMVDDHRSGRDNHSDALWTLLALESWKLSFGRPNSSRRP